MLVAWGSGSRPWRLNALYYLFVLERIRHLVSHVISSLVSVSFSMYSETWMWARVHRRSRIVLSLITALLVKRNMAKSQTQEKQGAVCGHESTKRCVFTLAHVEEDQTGGSKRGARNWFQNTRTGTCSCKRSRTFPSSKVIFIEKHLMPTCSRNNVYNTIQQKSKEMIRELGNVELFELCETTPKVQCVHCLLCWNQGIAYCTCGQCLTDSESRRKFTKLRLDALPILDYVIKKGTTHGARYGKTEVQREYHLAWNAWKRCSKKVDSQGAHLTGFHDGFLRDPVYRESQLPIGWSEQECKEWDELAKVDHTHRLTPEERWGYKGHWYLTLHKTGKMGQRNFDPVSEPLSWWKIAYTTNQEN